MGQVDLNFKPSVPVFDANVALGRRHNRLVSVDTKEGTLEAMGLAGVGRALVYSPHAEFFDSEEGNRILLDTVQGEPGLVPQFICNPTFDDLDSFAEDVHERGVRSVRMSPTVHKYPFRDWVVGAWMDWLARENLPLWISAGEVAPWLGTPLDPAEFHDTIKNNPEVTLVLSEVHYSQARWAMPLLRSLPNVHIELSRFVTSDSIPRLVETIGHERILFGSGFPSSPMAPQLYNLHRCGLSGPTLEAICSGNLDRLLGME
jgi:predicted TIM-barrel fold metal-dependent hydrolase